MSDKEVVGNEWDLLIAWRNGFGLDLSAPAKAYYTVEDDNKQLMHISVGGFELLLPFIAIQLMETTYYE
tara:strand:- start:13 stop:219 length:207 start_codon:yes stop_codon:yes gene_type:complete